MYYRITHTTRYLYDSPIDLCHNEARLTPLNLLRQTLHSHRLDISPEPVARRIREDYFGNGLVSFTIQRPHSSLEITARSLVETSVRDDDLMLRASPPWEEVRRQLHADPGPHNMEAREFIFDSPLIPSSDALRKFAAPSFGAGRPFLEAVENLMHRIFTEFEFVSGHTTISTPLEEVLKDRRGVCQDFAQLGIACLRSLGLPARYVSGYIETLPPEGQPRLVGADASHAWFAVHDPELGWVDFDPTNDQRASQRHIVLAFGRDYGDVPPLKGVMVGSGGHALEVSVDVEPLGKEAAAVAGK